jgi:hypothetical protein
MTMGGMKTGAGEDPFADDTNGDDGDREVITDTADGRKSTTPSRERRSSRRGDEDDAVRPGDLPLIARRNARGDNVKAGRETRRLFELRPDVAEKESAFMTELESRLETDVAKTDAREAALDVIYDRPGLVADRLEEWGINYFDDTA